MLLSSAYNAKTFSFMIFMIEIDFIILFLG